MARGENPGMVISVPTTLTYDPTQDFGHAQAGQDLMLSPASGQDAGKFQLSTRGQILVGKFMDLDKDGEARMMIEAKPMLMRRGPSAVEVGQRVIGSGPVNGVNGYVETVQEIELDPSTAGNPTDAELTTYSEEIQEYANGKGTVLEVLEDVSGGRILVLFTAG